MLRITADGTKDGKPTRYLILGLSHRNLTLLKEGKPIEFAGAEVGLPEIRVVIFAGESERTMLADLHGLIGRDTIVKFDPKLLD